MGPAIVGIAPPQSVVLLSFSCSWTAASAFAIVDRGPCASWLSMVHGARCTHCGTCAFGPWLQVVVSHRD